MSKKLVCLVLALMLVTAGVVYAAPVGSKMTGDLVQVGSVASSTGATIASDFAIDTKAETDYSKAVFEEIQSFLADGSKKIAEYFPAAVVSEIASQLAASGITGVSTDDLVVNEFMPLDVQNYAAEYGDLTVEFDFPTQFTVNDAVVALVGVNGATETEWNVVPSRVTVDGPVELTLTGDILGKVGSGAVLAILSAPAEAAE